MTGTTQQIVLIGPSAGRHRGGIAQFTSRLAAELSRRGAVAHFSWREIYPRFLLRRELCKSMQPETAVTSEFTLDYLSPRSWRTTADRIAELKPELILFSWSHVAHAPIYSWLVSRLRRATNAELCCIAHNVLPHETFPGASALTRRTFAKFDSIVVHSESDFAKLRELLPRTVARKLFLPLFDFLPQSGAGGGDTQKKYLLFFGNIRPYKGLDILLRSLPRVLQTFPDLQLRIAGEKFSESQSGLLKLLSPREEDPIPLIEQLDISRSVTADLRYIPDSELPELFAGAQAAVFPFRSTNQSATVNTAFGYGVPVVASNVGGLSEYITHGVNGQLVEPNDPDALAAGIIKLLQSPPTADAVRSSTQTHSWARYAHELLARTD